ncbi:MAG: Hpt domain-containing protein [Elusimicrobia bacterium]|nr:Hpt domain-containing protein [Elusimicrobiota bacterium]
MQPHGYAAATQPETPLHPESFAELRELFAGEPSGEFERFLDSYLAGAERGLREIRAAAGADPRAVVFSAHALKGSSANVGARRLAELCESLIAAAGDRARQDAILSSMEEEYERLRTALKES